MSYILKLKSYKADGTTKKAGDKVYFKGYYLFDSSYSRKGQYSSSHFTSDESDAFKSENIEQLKVLIEFLNKFFGYELSPARFGIIEVDLESEAAAIKEIEEM